MKTRNININRINSFLFFIVVVILSSCQATSFLKKDETYLRKNRIKFESQEKIENKIFIKQELSTLFEQIPNESFLWVPKQWFYFISLNKKSWFNRGLQKNFAEQPSIFNEKDTKVTAQKFEKHLRNNKGFYNATVTYDVYKEKYLTDVDYTIKTGKRYHIRSVKLECENDTIYKLLKKSFNNSHLIPGNPINSQDYNLEKIRITDILQNEGYATFNQNYIELKGDSSDYKVDYTLVIHNINENTHHEIYRIGKVDVFTDYYPNQNSDILDSLVIENIKFYRELDDFIVKPSRLFDIIALNSGELYKKKRNRRVYNKLSKFSIYRFVSIKSEIDTSNTNLINYKIYLHINKDKFYHEENINTNYVTLSAKRYFMEFETNGLFYNRNLTSRGDNLSIFVSGDIKVNIQTGENNELNLTSKIDYFDPISPKTIELSPLFIYYKLLKKKQYKEIKNHTSTKASLSYHNQKTFDYLLYSSLDLTYGYAYLPNNNLSIISNQFGLNYFAPTIIDSTKFSTFQIKSMKNVFITGLFIRNLSINYLSNPKNSLFSYKIFFGFEMSGSEIYLANKLYNSIAKSDNIWKANNDVKYSKYFKAHFDFRPSLKVTSKSDLAMRVFMGAGIPFGDSDFVPYIKQFEVGGPNSMRGWTARELGPGSYKHTQNSNELSYQKSDIRIEANLEYRMEITSLIRSAIFLDAGNIWSLKYDAERIGSQFNKSFYNQIAMDTGFSLQLFAKILFRLDFVYKIRNPYPDEKGRYLVKNSILPSTVVFAINHAF